MSAPVIIGDATLYHGECLAVLRTLPDACVDSVVTDPPYGLSFMGKRWDYDVPSVEIWAECLRVLKPGGHLLAFAGTRTQHRMAVRIEDAGFEIRDMLAWIYGSGFPKSHDVSKAIDAAAGTERLDAIKGGHMGAAGRAHGNDHINAAAREVEQTIPAVIGKGSLTRGTPVSEAAKQWDGFGTALKPALEPITLARKPLNGTVAANVLAHGTGGLNIAGCRIELPQGQTKDKGNPNRVGAKIGVTPFDCAASYDPTMGRWPANVLHDGSDEVVALFPSADAGGSVSATVLSKTGGEGTACYGEYDRVPWQSHNDSGSAARFFYCAKASKADRDEGLERAATHVLAMSNQAKAELARGNMHSGESGMNTAKLRKNHHPTVKPTDLMRYLLRLVTPPGGVALDPFMGSGSTGKAALLEHFRFIGIERDPDYFEIAKSRIDYIRKSGVQVGLFGEAA